MHNWNSTGIPLETPLGWGEGGKADSYLYCLPETLKYLTFAGFLRQLISKEYASAEIL
jgi:hypothetical protein